MSNSLAEKHVFTLNGVDFMYMVERLFAGGNESVDLFDANNEVVANAYIDHNLEDITLDIFESDEVTSLPYYELGDSTEKVARHMANALFDFA